MKTENIGILVVLLFFGGDIALLTFLLIKYNICYFYSTNCPLFTNIVFYSGIMALSFVSIFMIGFCKKCLDKNVEIEDESLHEVL